MNINDFLDASNKKYQIQVIAPTHTYGTMYSLDSKFDFEIDYDEYDTSDKWEFNIIVEGKTIATLNTTEEVKDYIEKSDFSIL